MRGPGGAVSVGTWDGMCGDLGRVGAGTGGGCGNLKEVGAGTRGEWVETYVENGEGPWRGVAGTLGGCVLGIGECCCKGKDRNIERESLKFEGIS